MKISGNDFHGSIFLKKVEPCLSAPYLSSVSTHPTPQRTQAQASYENVN